MCDQCKKVQEQISHYSQFVNKRMDPLTEQRIRELLADLEQRKAAIHVSEPSSRRLVKSRSKRSRQNYGFTG
jgi:arsenate reductase-like glutaredoxin family protein